MLPSLLARDIQTGLKQFLVTAFEPSDDFFHGLVSRFVENESAWMKGPFLQTGLPFRPGPAGRAFFEGFETQNPSYTHQEKSWQRLASQRGASNTIVATGTGSGKTECFLYPVLDHCARALKARRARRQGPGDLSDERAWPPTRRGASRRPSRRRQPSTVCVWVCSSEGTSVSQGPAW